jgi:hypothetical protein
MPSIRIRIEDVDKKKVKLGVTKSITGLWDAYGITLQDLANATVNVMEETIDANRKRPRGYDARGSNLVQALRNSVRIESSNGRLRIYLGDIDTLNRAAPYWRILNYGGNPFTGGKGYSSFGIFQDGAPVKGGGGNAWFEGGTNDKGRMFFMRPTKPIEGIRYLNAGIGWLKNQLPNVLNKIEKDKKDLAEAFTQAEKAIPLKFTMLAPAAQERIIMRRTRAFAERRQTLRFGRKVARAKMSRAPTYSVRSK